MKFLIVEPSPLPTLIPLEPKYSPVEIYKNAAKTEILLDYSDMTPTDASH